MEYRFSGKSGLQLPLVSLGLWHNFGSEDPFDVARDMLLHAWDKGVTHFDIANNYGPAPGTAEMTFGRVLREDLASHRDEMIISSKAGYWGWDGPYGNGGSRKYMIASCDQSLKRTGLEYFDIFYSHRYDPDTPIEETMQALVDIVRAGKALYVGISNYPAVGIHKILEIFSNALNLIMLSEFQHNQIVMTSVVPQLAVCRQLNTFCFNLRNQKLVLCLNLSFLSDQRHIINARENHRIDRHNRNTQE